MWWLFINSSPPPASLPAVLLFPQVTLSFSLPFIIIPSPVPSTLPSTPGKHVSETVLQSGLQVSCQCCIFLNSFVKKCYLCPWLQTTKTFTHLSNSMDGLCMWNVTLPQKRNFKLPSPSFFLHSLRKRDLCYGLNMLQISSKTWKTTM